MAASAGATAADPGCWVGSSGDGKALGHTAGDERHHGARCGTRVLHHDGLALSAHGDVTHSLDCRRHVLFVLKESKVSVSSWRESELVGDAKSGVHNMNIGLKSRG